MYDIKNFKHDSSMKLSYIYFSATKTSASNILTKYNRFSSNLRMLWVLVNAKRKYFTLIDFFGNFIKLWSFVGVIDVLKSTANTRQATTVALSTLNLLLLGFKQSRRLCIYCELTWSAGEKI